MIQSFQDKRTEQLFHGGKWLVSRGFPTELASVAQRKLQYLNAALQLHDLMTPPGNRLERLKGRMKAFYSIRINDQWRIVFRWEADNAYEVMVSDYH